MDAFYDIIYRKSQIVMMIGGACTEVAKYLAEIVPYWNLLLVSYAATSPALSAREKYKTFFRLAATDSSLNHARCSFIRHFRWKTVAVLYENTEKYSLAIENMQNEMEQFNITVKAWEGFAEMTSQGSEISDKLNNLKDADARIIVGIFSEAAARRVFCEFIMQTQGNDANTPAFATRSEDLLAALPEAFRHKLYGSRYVWILLGDYRDDWYEIDNPECGLEQINAAIERHFTISNFNSLVGNEKSIANMSSAEFEEELKNVNGSSPVSPNAATTYDSVWTLGLVLRNFQRELQRTLNQTDQLMSSSNDSVFNMSNALAISTKHFHSLDEFTYSNGAHFIRTFFDIISELQFNGVSGPVMFNGPDRQGSVVCRQFQGGKMETVALYHPFTDELSFTCSGCKNISWNGGKVPNDETIVVPRQKVIDKAAFFTSSVLSGVGVVIAVVFLCFNIYYRKLRYIKLSSPKLNNMAVVGCMLVYAGVILLGFDDSTLEMEYYPLVCSMRAFLFASGFSLSFGAMLTKTYRVHQIFTRASSGLIKSKLLKDKQLLFIIGALLVVDSAIMIVWVVVDPMDKISSNLTKEEANEGEDILYIIQISKCHSNHLEKWMGVFYAYKGLLLIFGVYMAWETRNVKIPVLNDSQYIGMNVYNAVIMSTTVVVVSNILSEQPTLSYVIQSAFMLFSTTATLCLLFVPKIYAILTSRGNPIIAACGFTVEANTRRFQVDEQRELIYRAEVQNRVYTREILALEQEINRLEHLLGLPIHSYPKLTEDQLCSLPESQVDELREETRPLVDIDMAPSISDGGEICYESEEEEIHNGKKWRMQYQKHSPLDRRNKTKDKVRKDSAIHRLKLFGRSLSFATNLLPTKETNIAPVNNRRISSPSQPTPRRRVTSNDSSLLKTLQRNSRAYEQPESESLLRKKQKKKKTSLSTLVEVDDLCLANPLLDRDKCTRTCLMRKSDPFVFQNPSRKLGRCNDLPMAEETSQTKSMCSVTPNTNGSMTSTVQSDPSDLDPRVVSCRPKQAPLVRGKTFPARARHSLIEHERRTRIRRLQSDLFRIQKELQDLGEFEYEVSVV